MLAPISSIDEETSSPRGGLGVRALRQGSGGIAYARGPGRDAGRRPPDGPDGLVERVSSSTRAPGRLAELVAPRPDPVDGVAAIRRPGGSRLPRRRSPRPS